ncbi:hypothetical protein B4Q13_21315, partial [Lacticaseibacillus rhamnosus]
MVKEVDDMRKITREELIRFANEHYKDNYVVVYKRTGKDPNARQVEKPDITKVTLNREARSQFHEQLLASEPEPIKPVFVDYEKDLSRLQMNKGIEVLYKKNEENELFNLYYLTETGTNNDPRRQEERHVDPQHPKKFIPFTRRDFPQRPQKSPHALVVLRLAAPVNAVGVRTAKNRQDTDIRPEDGLQKHHL